MKIYAGSEGNRSLSDNGDYLSYINSILSRQDLTGFKHHTFYNLVLEHATASDGIGYLNTIIKQTPEFLEIFEKFKINDIIGNLEYDITGAPAYLKLNDPLGKITPSTLKYIKIASDIKKYFGSLGASAKIAEIGVGYGGQCLILDQVFSWKKYYMFDLDLPLQLTTRYLENFTLNSSYTCTTLNRYSGEELLDMVISAVAFSELPSKIQKKYCEKVLSKAKRGYLVMNSGTEKSFFKGDFLTVEQLRSILPEFEIIPEISFSTLNYIIIWGHKK